MTLAAHKCRPPLVLFPVIGSLCVITIQLRPIICEVKLSIAPKAEHLEAISFLRNYTSYRSLHSLLNKSTSYTIA